MSLLLIMFGLISQQDPTANDGGGRNNQNYWSREGNTDNSGSNNIFGTRFNSPVYTITENKMRMKLNGTFTGNQYTINGYGFGNTNTTINTSGYLLLGNNGPTQTGGQLYQTKGAFSLLHLNGPDNSPTGFVQEYGFRPWMKTGITFTGNNDLMYHGIRQLEDPQDRTEFVTSWSDNSGANYPGPDDYAFRFVGVDQNAPTTYSSDYDSENDIDGRHVARFTGKGEFGLGPVFGVNTTGSPAYYRPQSIQHIGEDDYDNAWFQMTNTQGTGMTANDGIRLGIQGSASTGTNGYLSWQENNSFIVRTDWDNTPGGITNGERLRITTINDNQNAVPQPGNIIDLNTTRVAISYRGQNPVTAPRSLLHLGFNAGLLNGQHGWRNWMDFGTFTTNGQDHIYVGLKQEPGGTVFGISERMDAVIAWGDEESTSNNWGPDNMRFIFTEPNGGAVAGGQDGLEIARMTPESDGNSNGMLGVGDFTGSPVTHKLHVQGNGRFELVPTDASSEYIVLGKQENSTDDISLRKLAFTGDATDVLLGDGTWGPVNSSTDDQIITNFDFNNATNVLTIEIEDGNTATVDLSDLISTDDQNLTNAYLTGPNLTIEIENGASVTVDLSPLIQLLVANNGVSISPGNEIQLGVPCSSGAAVINANALTADRTVALGKQSLWFSTDLGGGTGVGFGEVNYNAAFCGVNNTVEISSNGANLQYGTNGSGLRFTHLTAGSATLPNGFNGVDNTKILSVDGDGDVVLVDATGGTSVGDYCNNAPVAPMTDDYLIEMDDKSYNFVSASAGRINIGQVFCGLNADARVYIRNNNSFSVGLRSESLQSNGVGGWFEGEKYGVYASASSNPTTPTPPAGNYAGYFNGDIHVTGTVYLANPAVVSDQMFKDNVNTLSNISSIIDQLNPVSYEYDTAFNNRMHFADGIQYGFIAQEVETILPSLVYEGQMAEVKDSLGNIIDSAQSYKALNYNGLFALLTKGIQEQQDVIEEQDSVIDVLDATVTYQDSLINDLNARLSALESCLSNILPELCQVNSTAIMQNDEQTQEAIVNQLEIILKDEKSIVLEQNVPNPFAEQTVINYYIPSTVQKAQIHFYNLEGQLINTVEVNEFGNGQLKVFGSDLSSGTYTYTLVADGKVIATKKMVKTN